MQLVWRLALACVLVQSIFVAPSRAQQPPAAGTQPSGPLPGDVVRITADRQEKFGPIYHLRGNVEILFHDMRLTADEVDYDQSTGSVDARGRVRFQRQAQQEDILAGDAHYNLDSERGQFYKVRGFIGARPAGPQPPTVLTTTNPYYFEAERIDKVGQNSYLVYDGFVTSCQPTNLIWTFTGSRALIKPDESATIYNATVKAGNKVPFFFSPFLYHSLKKIPRSTGFLTPTIGNSSRKGRVVGDSFFWAINRSMDAEGGLEYYSERGWAQRGTFRARPHVNTGISATYFGVVDRGLRLPDGGRFKQGGQTVIVEGSSELPRGFRAVANFNYLSSFRFRLAFTETFLEAVNTEVHSTAFVSNNFRGFSFNTYTSRFQNFQGFAGRISGDDPIDIRTMPSFEFNSRERPVFRRGSRWSRLPLYVSFDSAADGLARSEPPLVEGSRAPARVRTDALVSRFDFNPRMTLPLNWNGFHLTTTYGWRVTRYGSRLQAGRVVDEGLARSLQELNLELRTPSLQRVYDSPWKLFGTRLKHVIEPRASFRLVEGVSRFREVILFDERDLLTDTRELEYGLSNRLYSKRSDGVVREAVSWDLTQRYYFDPTFGGALHPGSRNVFASTLGLTGFTFLDGRRRFSPIASTIRFAPTWKLGADFRADWDPVRHRIVNSGVTLNTRAGNVFASVSDFYVSSSAVLQIPSHQVRAQLGYGYPNRLGWNIGVTGIYDVRQELVPYSAVQANYNWDCCGISFELRRFHFGRLLRDERQFRVAITFANIGTFGNLKKQERLF